MIIPTWDLIVSLVFIILIVYGIALGKEKVLVLLVSAYIGLIVATIWGGMVYDFISGSSASTSGTVLKANASLFTVKAIIFMVFTVLLVVKGDFLKKASASHDSLMSLLVGGLYAFFSAGLILTTIASFLPEIERSTIISQSTLAANIIDHQVWWIVLPALAIIVAGFRGGNTAEK